MICGSELIQEPLISLHNAPAYAQDLPGRDGLQDDQGMDLNLHQCPFCGLIQLDCEPVHYYKDVIRGGGFSETLQKLRKEQYSHLIHTYNLVGKKIIEIGCGEGEFILPLMDFPVEVFGIEHREELVHKAKDRGLNVWQAFPETADTVLEGGPFDAFLMFNFLEHQPNPNDMLRCIYNNLSENGVGMVTVPSFDYIYNKNAVYELMRDHIAYYTVDSLRLLMNHNGFETIEQEIVSGNTITTVIRKRKSINMRTFTESMEELQDCLHFFLKKTINEGKRIAVWGASHQAFMILSITDIGQHISYVIDSAPFKQNKYSPASHVPIVSPEYWFSNPVDCILILAPEYAEEIAQNAKALFGDTVETYSLDGNSLRHI